MNALFKYVRASNLPSIMQYGKFRIGTLFDFRKVEYHGEAIGDIGEGTHLTTLKTGVPKLVSFEDNSPEALFFRTHLGNIHSQNQKIYLAPDASITARTNSQNFFIFCSSLLFNANTMKEFGYDACIKIEDPEKFFNALSHSIRHKASYIGFSPVNYKHRNTDHLHPHLNHAALSKDPAYSYQAEVRALWQPLKTCIPLIAECKKALNYCSIYYK